MTQRKRPLGNVLFAFELCVSPLLLELDALFYKISKFNLKIFPFSAELNDFS